MVVEIAALSPTPPRFVDDRMPHVTAGLQLTKHISIVSSCFQVLILSFILLLPLSGFVVARAQTGVVDQFVGSYTEDIPIHVPVFHGLEPKLSLVYSSSQRNGFAGVGWSLKGFSVIERSTAVKGAPSYTDKDVFLLDGVELVPCAVGTLSPSCETGGTHATKIESYLRVTYDPLANGGQGAWTVSQKDGTTLRYAPVHVLPAALGGATFQWGIVQVLDVHGNAVTFGWTFDGLQRAAYPSTVSYSNVAVRLITETRPDLLSRGIGREMSLRNKRLGRVAIEIGGLPLRTYALSYSLDPIIGNSLLDSIQEWGKDANIAAKTGLRMPASAVDARSQPNAGGFAALTSDDLTTVYTRWDQNNKMLQGDFNGDGRIDLVQSFMSAKYKDQHEQAGWRTEVALSNGDGTFANVVSQTHSTAEWSDWQLTTGDFNGDGKTDLVATANYPYGWASYLLVSLGNGQFAPPKPQLHSVSFYSAWSTIANDFNGDGRSDLALTYADQFGWRTDIVLSVGDGNFDATTTTWHTREGLATAYWYILSGDFNGDGRADLAAVSTGRSQGWQAYIATSTGTGSFETSERFQLVAPVNSEGANDQAWHFWRFAVGDFNGDGLSDIVGCHAIGATGHAHAAISLGNGRFTTVKTTGNFLNTLIPSTSYITETSTGDINGDGLSDLLQISYQKRETEPGFDTNVALSIGGGQFTAPVRVTHTPKRWSQNTTVFSGDYDGDGKTDVVASVPRYSGTSPYWFAAVGLADNDQWYLATKFRNPLGGTSTISYAPSSTWANTNNPPIVQTAVAVALSDGRTPAVSTTKYEYSGGLYDGIERRFLGFHFVLRRIPPVSGAANGPTEETYFHQDYGSVSKAEWIITRSGTGALLSGTHFVYGTNGSSLPYQSLEREQWVFVAKGSAMRRARTRREFDNFDGTTWRPGYGNVIKENIDGDVDLVGDETRVETQFVVNPTKFLVDRPSIVQTFDGITGSTLLTQTRFSYDGASAGVMPTVGDATRVERWLDETNSWMPQNYAYDAVGNLVKSVDALGAEINYIFDPSGVFRLQVQRPDRLSGVTLLTQQSWDPVCGTLLSSRDPNGSAITRKYDALCRLVRSDGPLGWYENRVYFQLGDPLTQYVEIQTPPAAGTGHLWRRTYFDGLGQTYLEERRGPSAALTIRLSQTFNARGKVETQSLPRYTAPAPLLISWKYDDLDRVVEERLPDGAIRTTSYDLLSVTRTDEGGHRQTQRLDVQGRVTAQEEEEPTAAGIVIRRTVYAYDARGYLVSTTDPSNNVSRSQYNSLGQLRIQNDPDRNSIRQTFDLVGRVIGKIDALGQRTGVTYDDLGRTVRKVLRAGTASQSIATWKYDEIRAGFSNVGFLTSAVDQWGTVTYNRDGAGRLVDGARTINGRSFSFKKLYDAGGRLLSTTFPDGEQIGSAATPLQYDEAGRLFAIPGFVVGTLYTASGKVRVVANANSTRTLRCYNAHREFFLGVRTYRLTTGQATAWGLTFPADCSSNLPVTLQNIRIANDAEGRAIWQHSDIPNDNWIFGYDALHRLVRVTKNGATTTYAYDGIGNLVLNSSLGTYSYDPVQVHAVTAAGTASFTYDLTGNMTSRGGATISYDGENRPARVGTEQFGYDGDGVRLFRADGIDTTFFLGDDYQLHAGVVTKSISLGGVLVAERVGGINYWLHSDNIGSVRLVTDAAASPVTEPVYLPWGEIPGATTSDRRFTGQMHDPTGLIYLHARYYDPRIGRFITADQTIPTSRIIGLNRYAYAANDPINGTDIDGLGFFGDVADALGGAFRWGDRHVARVPLVGGLLTIGWRSDPLYGLSTGDWEGWGRATVSGGIIVAAAFATAATGGLAASNPGFYIVINAAIGFSSSTGVALVNGASNEQALKAGMVGAVIGGGTAALNVAYQAYQGEAAMTPVEAGDQNVFGLSGPRNPDFAEVSGEQYGSWYNNTRAHYSTDAEMISAFEGSPKWAGISKAPFMKSTGWIHDFINAYNEGPGYSTMVPAYLWTVGAYLGETGFSHAMSAALALRSGGGPSGVGGAPATSRGTSQQAILSSASGQLFGWWTPSPEIEALYRRRRR